MHAKLPDQPKTAWQERLTRSGFLIGAILLHLIIFLLVATLVIWQAPPPPASDSFQRVSIQTPPPPPPPQPTSSGAQANNPQFEPQPVVVPVITPPNVITSANINFTVDVSKTLNQSLNHSSDQMAQGSSLSSGLGGNGAFGPGGKSNPFGSVSGGGFVGDLYDMKQTFDQRPNSMASSKYEKEHPTQVAPKWKDLPSTREEIRVLQNYVTSFDDTLLQDYYHAPKPLFAAQVFIPKLNASEAPKAFGVEKTVQPRRWIVIYKAKIIPPVTGDFRFIGFADDYLVVNIDNQNVLDACFTKGQLAPDIDAKEDFGPGPAYTRVPLAGGSWIHMTAGIQMNLKMLIGEGPGGESAFFLFIQQKGVDYPKGDYPVFQVADVPLPAYPDRKGVPAAFSGKKMVFGLHSQ